MPQFAVDAVVGITTRGIGGRQTPAGVATDIQARRPGIGGSPIHQAVGIGIRQPSDIKVSVVNGQPAEPGHQRGVGGGGAAQTRR